MMLALRHYPGPLVAAFAVLAVLAVVFVAYGLLRKRMAPSVVWGLRTLRLLAMLLLLAILMDPVISGLGKAPAARRALIFMDGSRSMAIADAPGGRTRFDAARELALRQVAPALKDAELEWFVFADRVEKAEALDECVPDGRGTDLAGVLRRINENPERPDLALLLTDGAVTRGGDPVEYLRAAGSRAPVHVVGVGRSEGPPDIAVLEVAAPPAAAAGDRVPVSAVVAQRGFGGQEAALIVERNGKPLLARKVRFKDEPRQTFALEIAADTPGWMNYRLSIAAAGGPAELSRDNNAAGFSVRVAENEPLRVLYLEASLRWAVRFLRESLDSDSDVAADLRFDIVPEDRKKTKTPFFPATREELFRYDVVILGNLPAGGLRSEDLDALYDFVALRGGGLAIEGGVTPLDAYAGTPLAKLLPVFLGDAPAGTAAPPAAVSGRITDEGRHHPALAPLAAFTNLPLMKIGRDYRAKPSARVLLAAGAGGAPLILAQRFGRGYVLFSASGFLWKWGFPGIPAAAGRLPVYKDFWGRSLRWLGRNRYEATRYALATDKPSYAPGETVKARCEVQDAACRPDARAAVILKTGAGASYRMAPAPDQAGTYTAEFPKETAEPEFLTAFIESGGRLAGEARCAIQGHAGDEEAEDPALREPVLKAIAALSGGRYVRAGEADPLPQALAAGGARLAAPREERKLWDTWPLLAVLIGLLSAEWFLRRRSGLA